MDNCYGYNFINMMQQSIPGIRVVAGGSELLCRCPYCGDSLNPNHAHFYISVPQTADDLSFYNCVKCNTGGILSTEILRKLSCNDTSILQQTEMHNARVLKLPKYKTLKNVNVFPLTNKYIRQDNRNQSKLNYINQRIGSNMSYDQILSLKIFLNLYDVLNSNRLELTRDKRITDSLDENFIGFISYDNSYCGMRKVTDKTLYKTIDKRYINYNLVNKTNSKRFYMIPVSLNLLDPNPIRIHISEGQFDILSIYYNLNMCNQYQNIYISCGGKSYVQTLEFILTEFGIINYEIHFYPDNDVNDNEFNRNVLNKIGLLPCGVYVHRNMFNGEKDFGVPLNKIKDMVRVVK